MDVPRSRALLVFVTLLSAEHVLAACESAAGSWSATWDDGPIHYQYNFNLVQSGGSVTGSLSMTYCGPMTVDGLFYGNGAFAVTATPTSQTTPDCSQFSFMGTVDKPGCHNTTGVWVEPGLPWSWSKPCDIPNGEFSSPVSWDTGGTAFVWDVSLSPSSINFDGRTVTENVSLTDNCWFSGSAIAEQTGTNAPPADIIDNGYEDVVGWLPAAVSYYRSQGRAPCTFSATQQMRLDCSSGPVGYIVNGLGATIGVTTVSSSRQGQTQAHTWP